MDKGKIDRGKHEFTADVARQKMWLEFAYLDGWQERMTLDRSQAFCAIRRAAEVARRFDSRASFHGFDDDECDDYLGNAWGHAAKELRAAIRAAIGSHKA